jgi:hypothetical protein
MLEIEGRPGEGFVIRVNPPRSELIPEGTREHFRSARKEMLLAFRSFLDAAIEDLEKPAGERNQGGKQRQNIEVD